MIILILVNPLSEDHFEHPNDDQNLEENVSRQIQVYSRRNERNPPCALEKFSQNESIEETSQRRSNRISKIPNRFVSYDSFSPNFRACLLALHSFHEPSHYNDAKQYAHWNEAMELELNALKKAQTWEIIDPPNGKKPIGCRWVFKVKTKSDGSLERYKARLVAKGYAQEYGVDYDETFAPVARMTSVRALIAIASIKKWPIFQLDVKNAFLNGNLNEEVYMEPPPGMNLNGKILKLKKALYGLKQAPKAWYDKFSNVLINLGFTSCYTDTALFVKKTGDSIVILLLYVDDMIITGNDKKGVNDVKSMLKETFDMSDLGYLRYFLGIEVAYSPRGYILSQMKLAAEICTKSGISDEKKVETPEVINAKLRLEMVFFLKIQPPTVN